METWYYEVVSIDGDYANLKRIDIELDDLKLVARALLPAEIMVGSRLKYELMQYEIVQFWKVICGYCEKCVLNGSKRMKERCDRQC